MIDAIAERTPRLGGDQADGLRRLFAGRTARLLPVLAEGVSDVTPWLARLGQAFAGAGQRTLLIDGARSQVAAVLGLRARFDLLHVHEKQCGAADVRLDAAPGLTLVPAARALRRAAESGGRLPSVLAPVHERGTDVVLLLLPAGCAALLPAGDVLVPVLPTRESVGAAAAAIGEASRRRGSLAFRLLFLAMQREAAATLGGRMARSFGVRSQVRLASGGVVPVARDLAQVVAAAGQFALAGLAANPQPARSGAAP